MISTHKYSINILFWNFQVICTVLSTGKRKTIPLIVTISDINDNTPRFIDLPYVATIPEVNRNVFFHNLQSVIWGENKQT